MKRSSMRVILGLVLVLAASSLHAQTASLPFHEEWTDTVDAAKQGDFDTADLALQSLIDAGSAYGIVRFSTFAESAASLARSASDTSDDALRVWASNTALRLDADSPKVHLILAETARSNGDWGGVARSLVKGLLKIFSDYSTAIVARSDLFVSMTAALVAAGVVFALMLLLRYGRSAAHDFREIIGTKFRSGFASVVAFALLFLPLFLWLHPLWLIPYWLMLLFSYSSKTERTMIMIVLAIFATSPIFLEWNSYRVAGLENTVVQGAHQSNAGIYDPAIVQRMRDVVALVPENPRLRIIMANLVLQEGNKQRAKTHLEKAIELDDGIAGAHLNLGNLHFLNQEYQAAIVSYERAVQLDPHMAEGFYNHSVAAGEQFDFDTQSQKLEEANGANRGRVDKILANPPVMKVVNDHIPTADAWNLARKIHSEPEVSALFGNYAFYDPVLAAMNPLTGGSILALILGFTFWAKKRKTGFAGACVKCGRTFCHRCKSARESATYCTQCIHIYLKRDGVALEAKRRKLEEVQGYQRSTLRTRKILTTFLPGSSSMLEGNPGRGFVILSVFLLLVAFAVFSGRLAPIVTPAETMQFVLRFGSITVAALFWFVISVPVLKDTIA